MSRYILGIDQSTAGTKAVLVDGSGAIVARSDVAHEQKISAEGWVSHDPVEIYGNVLLCCRELLAHCGLPAVEIAAIGLSNQRETALVWDRDSGLPIRDAVVWQCGRAAELCAEPALAAQAGSILRRTGLPLSPYFSAAKLGWILRHTPQPEERRLCAGTMDSWLVFKLTGGRSFKTDYSNASRTQLLNLETLDWDDGLCALFGLSRELLPELCDSNACFGHTDLNGPLPMPVPILSVLGDSHAALFGQGCVEPGLAKATYGTGSSVMMNIGAERVDSRHGLVTSLAWRMDGRVQFVLEGNINYSGSVLHWLVEDLGLLDAVSDAGPVAESANPADSTYLVPAFTGLGAPHWNSEARGLFTGMTRATGRAELVRAAEECIAYQIADIVEAMNRDTGRAITELRVDGGPTRDTFLMQFQSDILDIDLSIPAREELSILGAGYAAGIKAGLYNANIATRMARRRFNPGMSDELRRAKRAGWRKALQAAMGLTSAVT